MSSVKIVSYLLIVAAATYLGILIGKSRAPSESDTPTAASSPEIASSTKTVSNTEITLSDEDPFAELRQKMSLEEAFDLKYSPAREYRIAKIFANMTLESSDEMLEYIKSNFSGVHERNLLKKYYRKMGSLDGANTFDSLLNSSERYRFDMLTAVSKGWVTQDPKAAWGATMEASGNGSTWRLNTYGPLWEIARRDPRLAVQLVQDLKDRDTAVGHMRTLVNAAAFTDGYEDVLDETLKVENPSLRNQMLNRIFESWGENDFESSYEALASIADTEQSDKAMRGMLIGWARVDGKGAFEYALENQDNPLIGRSLTHVAQEWATNSTAAELENFVTNLPEGHDWDDVTAAVSYSLARANPQLALDMSIQIEDEQKRARAVSSSMWAWTRSDIEGAEAHFDQIEEGKAKTWARYSLASANLELRNDPAGAIDYVNTIEDSTERKNMLDWLTDRMASNPNGIYPQTAIDGFADLLSSNTVLSAEERNEAIERLRKTP